ncbi:Gfo/Idh/MocA family protein [Paenibacillus elgii]|uniref:Gfo/Idh/MocA family protein n=1 Tax=Paenibacillus elgii TaxID=189691 RepID=UPI00203D74A6|nr:Gfo/Idh/MocA family oxidoreductase [Paenibacillus elgii]MCM3270131.1 Gfo/Idh/MocA family oxidoreductase [Paenibacillus elgii]
MKALLAGLGVAGFGMYKKLRQHEGMDVAVVEPNPAMKEKLGTDDTPFYTSLKEALSAEKPDIFVNVTPPHVHTAINNRVFDLGLPVLCEKPIAFDYNESIQIVERSVKERIPFMIAENYRRFPYMRKLKALLDAGTIGTVSTIDVQFYRYHHTQRNYTVSLLDDIAVHHFDLMRYLTGKEGVRIFARNYNPVGSWSAEPANINLYALLEMQDGIAVSYTGSITSRGEQTEWGGNWRIEGTTGVIEVKNKELLLFKDGAITRFNDYSDVVATDTLTEFLDSLREGRESESSGRDYLRTQGLVYSAAESSREGRALSIQQHRI